MCARRQTSWEQSSSCSRGSGTKHVLQTSVDLWCVACGVWLVAGVAHQPAGEAVGKRRASWHKGSWSVLANIPMQEVVAVKGTADAAALDIPAHYRFLTIRLRQAESVSEDDFRLNTHNRYLSAVNSSCQKPACIVCY